MKNKLILALTLGVFTYHLSAAPTTVAEWNFNSFGSTSDSNGFGETLLADAGSGSLFVQSATTTGTNFRRDAGNGTTLGATEDTVAGGMIDLRRGERWNNGYLDFSFDMTGLDSLTFSFAGNITASFPITTTLQWSNDGGDNFTNFETLTHADDSPTNSFSLFSYSYTNPDFGFSNLDNAENAVIRFQFSGDGGLGSSGSGFSIDNVVITAIPEPGTLALVAIALGSLALFRRRK